jgi:hypothetical protein
MTALGASIQYVSQVERDPIVSAGDRARGCASSAVLGLALCVPGAFAAAQVLNVATGSNQIGVLYEGCATFLIWLSVPVVFLCRTPLHRWRRSAPFTLSVLAVVVSTAFTFWVIRPQAPDGSAFDATYEHAVADLEEEVTVALDKTIPDRWHKPDQDEGPWLCQDKFGRDRGAGSGGPYFKITGELTAREFSALEDALSGPERDIQAPQFGLEEREISQQDNRYVLRLRTNRNGAESTLSIDTPCLRIEAGHG